MSNSIEKHLLPVRVRTEYDRNPKTGKDERVCYVECSNGEVLTASVPFEWAQYIACCLNQKRVTSARHAGSASNPIAVLRIDGEPMQKTSQIIGEDKKGNAVLVNSPAYSDSILKASLLGEDVFIQRWTQLPIATSVMVTCVYNVMESRRHSLPLCNAWALDLLKDLHIIKTRTRMQVKTMDGSRFIKVSEDPHTLIIIRKWEA